MDTVGHRSSPTVTADALGFQPLPGVQNLAPELQVPIVIPGLATPTSVAPSSPTLGSCSLLELPGTPSQIKDLDSNSHL